MKASIKGSFMGSKDQQLIRHFPWKKIPKTIRIIIIVLVIFITFDTFAIGYLKYTYNFVKCGNLPIAAVDKSKGAVSGYSLPSTSTYKVRAYNTYYCTVQKAEAAHEQPNPFSDEGYQRQEQLEHKTNL